MRAAARLSHRRGLTLVQMMVAITITGTVLTLAAGTLRTALRIQQHVDARSLARGSIQKLDAQFRDDVHRAKSYELSPPDAAEAAVTLALPAGASVRYVAVTDGVVRQESSGTASHRELYRLPPLVDQAWRATFTAAPAFVELRLLRGAPAGPATGQHAIAAAVGRDLRLAQNDRK